MTGADGVIRQTSSFSCAAASLANVAARRGIPMAEREAAERLGTTVTGTSPGQLLHALAELGLAPRIVETSRSSAGEVPSPAILFVDHPAVGRERHVVALMAVHGERFEVWDPLAGKMLLSADDLWRVWHGVGIAVGARTAK